MILKRKQIQHFAAVKIQKVGRGWLTRQNFERTKEKAIAVKERRRKVRRDRACA